MAVTKRKDRDAWQVYVVINGKKIRESFKTKKEALARERELHTQRTMGTFRPESQRRITFSQFVPEYLEWCELNKAKRTTEVETCTIRKNLVPFFGERSLDEITVPEIERYKLARKRDGKSPRTINLDLTILSVMFKQAIEREYVQENPLRRTRKLKLSSKPPRFLSGDEIERLLTTAKDSYLYPLIVCALNTGMRKSELFHLRWEHVDFGAKTVTVQPTDDWHTKNYDFRVIEMTETLCETLRALYDNRLSDEYVFTYGGNPLLSNITRSWRTVVTKAGIENCSLHTLRHTFGSHLATQGVPLMQIQRLMGHKDYDTTLIYAHLSKESERGIVHALPFGKLNRES